MRPTCGLHMRSSTCQLNIIVLIYFFISLDPRRYFAESVAKMQEGTASVEKLEISGRRTSSSHVFKETIARLSSRKDLKKGSRQIGEYVHEVVFVIRQKNMDELTRVLLEVSDPRSASYGQHLKREEVIKMTSNPEARSAVVNYLESNHASIISETQGSEYITASAPIFVWEKVFNTEFFQFEEASASEIIVRAESYSVPQELNSHIESVFNIIDIPCRSCSHSYTSVVGFGDTAGEPKLVSGYITPALLNRYYNMGSSAGSAQSTQAFYDTGSQYFSPADLLRFEKYFYLPNNTVLTSIGGRSSDSPDKKYYEGNLDAQYITSTSPNSPTTGWYTSGRFSAWLVQVGNTSTPPLVLSISYGQDEEYVDNGIHSAFNTEAIKLGAMGVTIVAASGNDGVSNRAARGGSLGQCSYAPDFPASSPFVTAVGATSGAENNKPETTCQSDNGNDITSGGGFSNQYRAPHFQRANIDNYFRYLKKTKKTPYEGFNRTGRGYPDVSLAGFNYLYFVNNTRVATSGTSASAPVIAGMFSNINAARMAVGKGSVGWANPFLYDGSSRFFNDIRTGHNKCVAGGGCCSEGFYAAPGWDPVSGLGSVDYGKMLTAFLAAGGVNNASFCPSQSPTYRLSRRPSACPTVRPTEHSLGPSHLPTPILSTHSPTAPTFSPAYYPSNTPSTTLPTLYPPTESPTNMTEQPTSYPSASDDVTSEPTRFSTPSFMRPGALVNNEKKSETAAEIVGGLIGGLAVVAAAVMVFFWKPCRVRTQYGTANITAV